MIQMTATVEHDLRDAVLLRLLADDLAEGSRALDGAALLARGLELGTEREYVVESGAE